MATRKTNTKEQTVEQFIAAQLEAGVEPDNIKVALVTDHALSFNKAAAVFAKYLKDNGMQTVRTGFTAQFYEWLEDGVKTQDEAEAYIKEHGSDNSWRQRNHYLNVMRFSNRMHEKYGA